MIREKGMARHRILNSRKRSLYRKDFPFIEIWSSLFVLACLGSVIIWVTFQKNNFSAEERDLTYDQLLASSVEDNLYSPPFKYWSPPQAQITSTIVSPKLGIFPPTILSESWIQGSRLKRFSSDNLYEKINGEAEKFISLGFQSLHYLSIKQINGNEEISIELFDQGSTKGSWGAFSEHRSSKSIIKNTDRVIYFQTSVGAIGMGGRYFFRIAGNQESQLIEDKTMMLLVSFNDLAQSPEDSAKGLNILNQKLKISPNFISYESQNVFQFHFAQDFWFGQPIKGSHARYFIHEGIDPKSSTALYNRLIEALSEDYESIQFTEKRHTFKHPFLKTYFIVSHQMNLVFGIENMEQSLNWKTQIATFQKALMDEK